MSSKNPRLWLILVFLWLLHANATNAQTNIGLKISPTIMFSRISNVPDSMTMETGGASFRPIVGLFFDFPIGYQYYFSTGINYATKPITLNFRGSTDTMIEEKYILQYLQFPITLKLFTSEVALDKKLYVQVGSLVEIEIHEEAKSNTSESIQGFNTWGITLNLGAGMEFRLGPHTFLQTGISYNRGLANIVENSSISNDLSLKTDMVSIDLALTF